jgi:hypothetical protein
MSGYALELWDSKRDGVPANFDKAVAIAASLRRQPVALTPALIEFNQYYYDYLVKNQENIDSPYFVENQLRHKSDDWPFALLVVDLPEYGWEPMLKKLVSIANQLGLVVFSNDFASFFLPNGKILPPSRKKIWQGFNEFLEKEQDFPTTRKAFTKLAHPMVDIIIRRHGFEPFIDDYPDKDYPFERFDYQKEISNLGTAKIHVEYRGGIHEFQICIGFFFFSNKVYDIYSQLNFNKNIKGCFSVSLSQDFIDRYKSSLWNIADKIALAERLVLLNKVMTNIFGNLKTIKDLDDLVNGNACEPVKRKIRDYWMCTQHALIIARLANNPEFEQLAIDLQQKGTFIEEWPKFVKYLQEEVKPLV